MKIYCMASPHSHSIDGIERLKSHIIEAGKRKSYNPTTTQQRIQAFLNLKKLIANYFYPTDNKDKFPDEIVPGNFFPSLYHSIMAKKSQNHRWTRLGP